MTEARARAAHDCAASRGRARLAAARARDELPSEAATTLRPTRAVRAAVACRSALRRRRSWKMSTAAAFPSAALAAADRADALYAHRAAESSSAARGLAAYQCTEPRAEAAHAAYGGRPAPRAKRQETRGCHYKTPVGAPTAAASNRRRARGGPRRPRVTLARRRSASLGYSARMGRRAAGSVLSQLMPRRHPPYKLRPSIFADHARAPKRPTFAAEMASRLAMPRQNAKEARARARASRGTDGGPLRSARAVGSGEPRRLTGPRMRCTKRRGRAGGASTCTLAEVAIGR